MKKKAMLLLLALSFIGGVYFHHTIDRVIRPVVCVVQTWQHPNPRCTIDGNDGVEKKKLTPPSRPARLYNNRQNG